MTWRPGTPALPFNSGKHKRCPTGHRRQEVSENFFAGLELQSGYALPPFQAGHPRRLTLIDAGVSPCLPRRKETQRSYRRYANLYLGDWRSRPLDAIARRDIEDRFHLVTERHGAVPANQTLSFLRSVYRRPCVDHEGLRNPVELWLAGGGRYHPKTRKRISSPAEVLPRWREGIEAAVRNPVHRDLLLFGLYTGMRRGEIMPLSWDRVDLDAGLFRVEETKSGVPLELPVTRQLGVILARRRANSDAMPSDLRGWVFPSQSSASGHVEELHTHYARIAEAGGAKFWFHGLRNAFITVAERELMLPRSLTKRLVNHARPSDVTEGYAADWTVEQLREPAQRIADRIDELMGATVDALVAGSSEIRDH